MIKRKCKKAKYLDLARELKKLWNMKVTIISIVIGALGTVTKGLINKETGGLRNQRMNGDHPKYSIIDIGQNTEKSPGVFEETCCHLNSSERPSANANLME